VDDRCFDLAFAILEKACPEMPAEKLSKLVVRLAEEIQDFVQGRVEEIAAEAGNERV